MGEWGKVFFLYDYERKNRNGEPEPVRGLIAKAYKYSPPPHLFLHAMNGVRYFLAHCDDRYYRLGLDGRDYEKLNMAFDVFFDHGEVFPGSDHVALTLSSWNADPDAVKTDQELSYSLFGGDEFWGAMYISYTGNLKDGCKLQYDCYFSYGLPDEEQIPSMDLKNVRDAYLSRYYKDGINEYSEDEKAMMDEAIAFFEEANASFAPDDDSFQHATDLIRDYHHSQFAGSAGAEASEGFPVAIDALGLSVRAYNCLKRAHIDSIEQLTDMTEEDLKQVRNLGHNNIEEINDKLRERGLSLKTLAP